MMIDRSYVLAFSLVMLVCCLLEANQRALRLEYGPIASREMLGFATASEIEWAIAAIPMATFGTIVAIMALSVVLSQFSRTIHDRATGETVVLSLERQHKYFLFLSHIWGSGQDQVAAIKRQLCLLVPGVSIFLE